MKRTIAAFGTVCMLAVTPVLADHLKESLSGMLKKNDSTPSMVNLNGIGLDGQKHPSRPKKHSAKATVAVIEGHKITKKEADAYLSKRTGGKISDFDRLPKAQRIALIKELSLPMLLAKKAKASLSKEDQQALISRAWMYTSMAQAQIPDEQIKAAYNRIKAEATAKGALAQVPPLDRIKDRIKMQIAQQQIIGQMMRGVDIKIAKDSDKTAGYAGSIPISIDEANKALARMTKGKYTWKTLPEKEKLQALNMIAPGKLIMMSAENAMTQKQKDTVLANYWMQTELSKIKVSDKKAKKRYSKIKEMLKKSKNKHKLPEYSVLEKRLKMEIAKEKFIRNITQHVHIKLK